MSANDRQHGGQHYRSTFQHWDMLPDIGFGPEYYVGCATKYITRHTQKNGAEDVMKAIHFMEKVVELIKANRVSVWVVPQIFGERAYGNICDFIQANGLPPEGFEAKFLREVLFVCSLDSYERAIKLARQLLKHEYRFADPSEATPAYVDQAAEGAKKPFQLR